MSPKREFVPSVHSDVPIALLSGRGELPRKLISIFQSQNRPFVVLAFNGQTEESTVAGIPHLWLNFAEVGKAIKYLRENNIKQIVMAGAMSRPAMSDMRPDWEGVKWLAKIGRQGLGDDGFLKAIISMIEDRGFQVVGPDDIVSDLLPTEGNLTEIEPDEQAWDDIKRGVEILNALSPVDVGQAVVVQGGLVLGIEAIEGTDALIERAGALQRSGPGGVLIKMPKQGQESRVDLPTIGVDTIKKVSEAGLRGIAVRSGKTLIVDSAAVIQLANEKDVFVIILE